MPDRTEQEEENKMFDPAEVGPDIVLPALWEDARPYLERTLTGRGRAWEQRFAAIEQNIDILRTHLDDNFTKLKQGQVEIRQHLTDGDEKRECLRVGIDDINNRIINVSESFSTHLSMVNASILDQAEKWYSYNVRQNEISENVKEGVKLLKREDSGRTFWRSAILITCWILFFAILFAKKTI